MEERMKNLAGEGKKSEILGFPPFGVPPFGLSPRPLPLLSGFGAWPKAVLASTGLA